MQKQMSSFLFLLLFSFSSQVNAITPEQFDYYFNRWACKNELTDGYQQHRMNCLTSKLCDGIPQPIDELIENVLNLFKEEEYLLENLSSSQAETLFSFIDTVISKLLQNYANGSLVLLENTSLDDIFTSEDISILTTILFFYSQTKDIPSLADIFCQRISAFMMVQFKDLTLERSAFLVEMIEAMPKEQRIIFLSCTPLADEMKIKVALRLDINELNHRKNELIKSLSFN